MRALLTILGILILGAIIWAVVRNNDEVVNGDNNIACTMDAKLCPDGSSVGRDPQNNCEFRACPGEVNGTSTEDEIIFDKG
jgi:hypothetical protein